MSLLLLNWEGNTCALTFLIFITMEKDRRLQEHDLKMEGIFQINCFAVQVSQKLLF